MKYRLLGRTGLRVSEIGLGCEGFHGKSEEEADRLFQTALKHGVNCMDLYTPDPAVHKMVSRNIQNQRDTFVLQAHLCTIWKNGQYERTRVPQEVEAAFEALLGQLQTSYIDIGMIHYVDSEKAWEEIAQGPLMEYAQRQQKEGRLRSIGLSSHNPKAAQKAVESGLVDVLMFSINPCYDLLPGGENCEELWKEESYSKELLNMDPDREALYETCQRRGVGITVMKAFGGGDLLDKKLSPAGAALTPVQCIHYALTRPAVASVMAGAYNEAELLDSLAYELASEQEKDYAEAFAAFPRISWQGHCMYCGHCAPCPQGIDVASVTKFLNLAKAQGTAPETVRQHYEVLEHHAGECIGCRACEKRCPFGVKIVENMRQAAQVFGK